MRCGTARGPLSGRAASSQLWSETSLVLGEASLASWKRAVKLAPERHEFYAGIAQAREEGGKGRGKAGRGPGVAARARMLSPSGCGILGRPAVGRSLYRCVRENGSESSE